MEKRFFILIAALFCLPALQLFAQARGADLTPPPANLEGTPPLPREFRKLTLGMDLESLKTALAADDAFAFRGDADVSFLPLREQNVVDTAGAGFVKRAFFQLEETARADGATTPGGVFIMAFVLNTGKVDHYSVFTRFVEQYGDPAVLNPKLAFWEDGATRIYLERPLTVKYIDKAVFDKHIENSKALESENAKLREEFLNEF
ncbi:MAG: hypothetical protein LBG74_08270 [Spirochaetaceae bacterium]|jgi:hypothetical protein|nr:hypothetical protein [Spirochaetaceae bacterium]